MIFVHQSVMSLNNKNGYEIWVLIADMTVSVLWHVTPCSFVGIYRRFQDSFCLPHTGYKNTQYRLTKFQ